MKYLSVCSGIEAATVAWHPLGWEPIAFCEIESFPSAVLAHHYPDVPNLGDMTGVAALVRSGAVVAPDVLVGGTPCQAFSYAGLRRSLDDARGQLTLSFVDLANAIDAMRTVPAIIVWENVPGVLSTRDNAFGCFLGALAGEDDPLLPPGKKNGGFERWPNAGCVYGPQRTIAWRVLDAQYVGVAQRRRRVFVVASARDGFDPAAVLFEFDGVRRDIAPSRATRQNITHDVAPCLTGGGRGVQRTGEFGGQHSVVAITYMAQCQGGVDVAKDRCTPLSWNLEAPPAVYAFQTRIARNGRGDMGEVCNSLTAQAGGTGTGDTAPCVVYPILEVGKRTGISTTDKRAGCGIGSCDDPMFTLQAGARHGIAYQSVCATGEVTHTSRAEGFDASEDGTGCGTPLVPVMSIQNATRGKSQNGLGIGSDVMYTLDHGSQHAVAVPVAFSCKNSGNDVQIDVTPTLRAMVHGQSHANGGGQLAVAFEPRYYLRENKTGGAPSETVTLTCGGKLGDSTPHVACGMAVRRLTPRECERLQGFPDDYTLIPNPRSKRIRPEKLDIDYIKYLTRGGRLSFEKCINAAADGPRYKACGNSMAVPVMHWLGCRIQMFADAATLNANLFESSEIDQDE